FNTVRLAEFAWGLLEPEPDRCDFAWLDRAVDVLNAHGLRVVLSTPTAAPPPWLLAAHPDIAQVDEQGRRVGPGTRREACANHPVYQERSRRIVEQMAAHYGHHPGVIGWQTDNEFGCHDSARCYCPHCQAAFRAWLQEKFTHVDTLNRAWGGAFWGEVYTSWEEIPLPTRSRAQRNPSHLLDFQRFSSDVWRRYHAQQIAILRRRCPNHFVTHNLMGFFPDLNAYHLCEGLDFVSWDNYHYFGATPATVAASHDHMRGVLRRNFWVMEQQAGQINWSVYNPAPPPNFVRLKTYQAIAHGGDGVIYFRWRQARAGSEQYHSGLLDHAGRTTAGYEEARQIGAELQRLAPMLAGTAPRPKVAILLDYDSRWVLEEQPHNQLLRMNQPPDFVLPHPVLLMDREDEPDERFMTGRAWLAWQFLAPYIALWEDNIPADIVAPEADLTGYRVVLAPFLNLLRPAVVSNLRRFVQAGGALILGPRSGLKDEHNRLFTTPQPGPLTELTGSTVRFFDSLSPERSNELRWQESVTRMGRVSPVGFWAEVL
ncbi:MAG: beta-galactosidase, partial [Caldilineae bacterium]